MPWRDHLIKISYRKCVIHLVCVFIFISLAGIFISHVFYIQLRQTEIELSSVKKYAKNHQFDWLMKTKKERKILIHHLKNIYAIRHKNNQMIFFINLIINQKDKIIVNSLVIKDSIIMIEGSCHGIDQSKNIINKLRAKNLLKKIKIKIKKTYLKNDKVIIDFTVRGEIND